MTETYSITNDFGEPPNHAQLHQEIVDSSITTTLTGILIDGDDVNVIFVSTISAGEKTTLDGLVSSHTPDATFGQDNKGTLYIADGSGSIAVLEPGTNNDLLIVDSTTSAGIKYTNPLPKKYIRYDIKS